MESYCNYVSYTSAKIDYYTPPNNHHSLDEGFFIQLGVSFIANLIQHFGFTPMREFGYRDCNFNLITAEN